MPSQLLLSVKDASVRYAEKPVFEHLEFMIHAKSRIALVGKNGAGKSTLMNIITGVQDLDEGERWEEAGLSIGYLRQDITPKKNQTVFDYIFEEFPENERDMHEYKVDMIAEALQLDKEAEMTVLSGGQLRRAGLARCLVEEPDILLLDEPTNHLDLEAIEWLERYLKSYRGTLLCISHDRTFLSNVTNQVFWLDRGSLKVSPRGFKYFEEWSTELLEQEERELRNRKQAMAVDIAWASRGVKARVKRNVRRLAQVKEMRDKLRADESAYRKATQKIDIKSTGDIDKSSKTVAEFYNVHKSFENDHTTIKIFDCFSLRIGRGDRIGILGKNGSGKTSFLKLLLKEIEPDQGRVKVRKEMEFSYFDQKRRDLNPDDTLMKTLSPNGGDYIEVMGKKRHVCGYLKDFMFDPSRAQDKIYQLSGGQKNRLMLAKILADPKTCLILDEPTNDLDMDTLDMLEEILSQYKGTLIIVSHDRDFLDQTVTKILAFEGNGEVESLIGGYSDYLAFKKAKAKDIHPVPKENSKRTEASPKPVKMKTQNKKLSYKYERELELLPDKMDRIEADITKMSKQLADGNFYTRDPDAFHEMTEELDQAKKNLSRSEDRWLELSALKNKT